LIVALTIPFALLFASICLDLNKIPANLLSLGALDFGMVVDGTVVIIENIVRHFSLASSSQRSPQEIIRDAVLEVLRPVFYARAIIITAYLPIFTLQSVEGRLFKPLAYTKTFAMAGADHTASTAVITAVLRFIVSGLHLRQVGPHLGVRVTIVVDPGRPLTALTAFKNGPWHLELAQLFCQRQHTRVDVLSL